tara:strand:- start:254 stop:532 length:279 start_codon:yes stop_codon:yes gene_type:complete
MNNEIYNAEELAIDLSLGHKLSVLSGGVPYPINVSAREWLVYYEDRIWNIYINEAAEIQTTEVGGKGDSNYLISKRMTLHCKASNTRYTINY